MRIFIISALCSVLLCSCLSNEKGGGTVYHAVVGDMAPAFSVTDSTGATVTSTELMEGRRALLMFFSTSCPYCRAELPVIEEVWRECEDDPSVAIVVVARDGYGTEDPQNHDVISAYWQHPEGSGDTILPPFTMPWYVDTDRVAFDKFVSQGVPRIYIIGPDGRIEWMTADGSSAPTLGLLLSLLGQ